MGGGELGILTCLLDGRGLDADLLRGELLLVLLLVLHEGEGEDLADGVLVSVSLVYHGGSGRGQHTLLVRNITRRSMPIPQPLLSLVRE